MYEARLPHGVLGDGLRRQDVVLRLPTGADEALLVEGPTGASVAARVSALLARCVERLGGEPCGVETVRELTVGDREALLLHLRGAAFGERLTCALPCPACGELMDLELSVGDLLIAPYTDAREAHELALAGGGMVRFRLPTGGDQEAAAAARTAEDGALLLLERCVLGVDDAGDRADVETLGAEMARLDPQAELRLAATCPGCNEPVEATLDAGTMLLDELAPSADTLFREVHALARHYHWSEGEILGLDLRRRRRYLALLVADEAAPGIAP